jgi:methyl-accepting chemotaxis protein
VLAFALLVYVMVRVLGHQDSIVKQASKEREGWLETLKLEREQFVSVLGDISKNFEAHSSRAKEFHRQIRDAHAFQREEHIKMIENLNQMTVKIHEGNGEVRNAIEQMKIITEQRSKENTQLLSTLEKMNKNCTEHGLLLARLNGKKLERVNE